MRRSGPHTLPDGTIVEPYCDRTIDAAPITATPRHPGACTWRPSKDIHTDERGRYYDVIAASIEEVAKARQTSELLLLVVRELVGGGNVPVDLEAEAAVWGYLRAVADEGGWRAVCAYLPRVKGLLTCRPPDKWREPTLAWSEAVRRLQVAAELRRAMGRIRLAMRRAQGLDREGTIRALRGAVDVFGEGSASKAVELQWRVAELKAEVRELERAKGA